MSRPIRTRFGLAAICLVLLLGADRAPAQTAFGLGAGADDQGRAVALDPTGNTWLTGYFNGTVDFDPGPGVVALTAPAGQEAVYVVGYDGTGAVIFARSFGGIGRGIATDAAGNVYVTGEIGTGGVDVDPGPDEVVLVWTEGRVFLVSYDPAGNLRFGFNFGGGVTNRIESGYDIGLDAAGNVYLTGVVNEETDFDPTAGEVLAPTSGITDAFVASYTSLGGVRWGFVLGSRLLDAGYGLGVDGQGDVVVTGVFSDTLDFDPGPAVAAIATAGQRDTYVAGYDSDGQYRFAGSIGGTSEDVGLDVALAADGNSYVTGWFRGDSDFDPGPGTFLLAAGATDDAFLASYDAGGALRFAFRLGAVSTAMAANAVALDGQDRPVITGRFRSPIDFDPGPGSVVLSGGQDVFVAGYDDLGGYRFATSFEDVGTEFADEGHGVAVAGDGAILVTGSCAGVTDFDAGPGQILVTSQGAADAFLATFQPAVSAVGDAGPARSGAFARAFPNPTSGSTRVRLEAAAAGPVRVDVYDLAGRRVARLLDADLPAGAVRMLEFAGRQLPSGVYFVQVSDRRGTTTERVALVR
ncbi:T9SS type A sorting domain-containing protein [bacterium]|nr:T9SS type A sorting domain-containing protein [bacterium]